MGVLSHCRNMTIVCEAVVVESITSVLMLTEALVVIRLFCLFCVRLNEICIEEAYIK
jgi:hypothetical protein